MLRIIIINEPYLTIISISYNWPQVKKQYPNALECSIVDHSDGCGAKLELSIVSNTFEGMPLLKRHREVNNVLKEKGLWEELHALQVVAWTEEQWEKKKGGGKKTNGDGEKVEKMEE